MRIHVDTLFALDGILYRPGPADAPESTALWAIAQGYARSADAEAVNAPANKAHQSAPKKSVKPKIQEQ